MTMQKEVLPVQCTHCGTIFDLNHDFSFYKGEDMEEMKAKGFGEKEHFCWECRQRLFGENSGFSDVDIEVELEIESELEHYLDR